MVYTDYDPGRLTLAAAAGAEAISLDYTADPEPMENFLITVDASAMGQGLRFALQSTAPCGYCTGVSGGLEATTELPLNSLYLRGITYNVSRVHSSAVLPEVLCHASCKRINPLAIEPLRASFDDATQAMFDPAAKVIFSP